MNKELDNLVFSTKSIMITDKQKHLIEDLLDQLVDMGIYTYDNIEYWKLSKQDAAKLIGELMDEIESNYFSFESWYESEVEDCGDR